MRFPHLALLLTLLLVALPACSKSSEEANRPTPAAGGGFNPAQGSNLTYTAPSDWVEEQPASRMRRAQYRLPHVAPDAEDAEMVVFYFPGQGGSVQANIDRWVGMFTREDGTAVSQPKISKREINGLPITVVDVEGTYTNQSMGGPMTGAGQAKPQPNYRMLAAIVETGGGPWFFKLTGPKETVTKWEPSFNSFLGTIRVG